MNYINYKKTLKPLHDYGWKSSYFTSADVSIFGYGFGVSQYHQFYVKDLDMYQVLPRPYLWSFSGGPGDKLILKMGVRLASQAETFFWECIQFRITSDDIGRGKRSRYLTTLKEKLEKAKEIIPSICRIGEPILPIWISLVVDSSVITLKI